MLKEKVIPNLIASQGKDEVLKLWVVGCDASRNQQNGARPKKVGFSSVRCFYPLYSSNFLRAYAYAPKAMVLLAPKTETPIATRGTSSYRTIFLLPGTFNAL